LSLLAQAQTLIIRAAERSGQILKQRETPIRAIERASSGHLAKVVRSNTSSTVPPGPTLNLNQRSSQRSSSEEGDLAIPEQTASANLSSAPRSIALSGRRDPGGGAARLFKSPSFNSTASFKAASNARVNSAEIGLLPTDDQKALETLRMP
jgi:hypothetical protein